MGTMAVRWEGGVLMGTIAVRWERGVLMGTVAVHWEAGSSWEPSPFIGREGF